MVRPLPLPRPIAARFLALALGLALLLGGVVPLVRARSAPITVRILMPAAFVTATEELVAGFNRTRSDLRIEVARGPLDTDAMSDLAISSLLLGDSPYDALLVDVSWLAKYVAAGWLLPLEDLLGRDSLEGMVPGARLGNEFDGHLWRMPLNGDTGLLYWRTDLMEGPPRTPQELEAVARSLQREGRVRWGYVWQGRQYEGLSCVVLEVLHAFDARWWRSPLRATLGDGGDPGQQEQGAEVWGAGRTDLGSAAAARAAGWLEGLIRRGISPPAVANYAEAEALQTFAAGDAAFLRNWPYAWRELERMQSPVVGKVGVTTVPGPPGRPGSGTLGTWGFSLLAGTSHPQATAEVIRWFTGPDSQRQLTVRFGYAPTWEALYEDPALARRQPLLPVQRQALERPALRPPTPLYAQLSDLLQRRVNAMLTGHGSAAAAMARTQSRSEVLLQAAAGRESG